MKKTYIQPQLFCCEVRCKKMLLTASQNATLQNESATVDGSGYYNNEVKTNSYNVWNDDWSQ